jgi:hypothetical protein
VRRPVDHQAHTGADLPLLFQAVCPADAQGTGVGRYGGGQYPQQGALARAIRPHEAEDLPGGDRDAHALNATPAALVEAGDVLCFECGLEACGAGSHHKRIVASRRRDHC